jgi:hypothetical protein
MAPRGFVFLFVAVTTLTTAALMLLKSAFHGQGAMTAPGLVAAVLALAGLVVLMRVVVVTERTRMR